MEKEGGKLRLFFLLHFSSRNSRRKSKEGRARHPSADRNAAKKKGENARRLQKSFHLNKQVAVIWGKSPRARRSQTCSLFPERRKRDAVWNLSPFLFHRHASPAGRRVKKLLVAMKRHRVGGKKKREEREEITPILSLLSLLIALLSSKKENCKAKSANRCR